MSLNNPNLELTKKQKEFSVSEVMLQYDSSLSLEKQQGNYGLLPFDIRYTILRNKN